MTAEQQVWFTGDHHWGHPRMREESFGGRPFATTEEMDEAMIQGWVDRVKPGDRVYHLGDFAFTKDLGFIDRLPGQLYLVQGNHDRNRVLKHPRWIWVKDAEYLKVRGQKIHLSHYPFETWRSAHWGAWHLHGHSHGNLAHRGRRMDVGVDGHPDFAPWSFDEVAQVMEGRPFVQVDHHRES
jgi:calcineurin-like phosphoesterase family protein